MSTVWLTMTGHLLPAGSPVFSAPPAPEAGKEPSPCCGKPVMCNRPCTPRGRWLVTGFLDGVRIPPAEGDGQNAAQEDSEVQGQPTTPSFVPPAAAPATPPAATEGLADTLFNRLALTPVDAWHISGIEAITIMQGLESLRSRQEGGVWVPREPTEEMITTYLTAQHKSCFDSDQRGSQVFVRKAFVDGYKAMLAASTKEPK